MPTKYQVEIGRVALINFGSDAGKLVVIVDIVDQNRALVDGTPVGVKRQAVQFKRLRLTKFKLDIPFATNSKVVQKAWNAAEIDKNWAQTTLAQQMAKRELKTNMNDFDRFKLYKAKQRYNRIVNSKLALLKFNTKKALRAKQGVKKVAAK